jgi:hypothetical protein
MIDVGAGTPEMNKAPTRIQIFSEINFENDFPSGQQWNSSRERKENAYSRTLTQHRTGEQLKKYRYHYPVFLKKSDFSLIVDADQKRVEKELYNRPVRKFGYLWPNDVFSR